jgi:hypothetical protein
LSYSSPPLPFSITSLKAVGKYHFSMGYARPIQFLWFAGAAVFVLALFHSLSGGTSSGWISTIKLPSLTKARGDGRVPLKQFIDLAEHIWEKTIRQRIEMRKDWDDQQNMPLYGCLAYISRHGC